MALATGLALSSSDDNDDDELLSLSLLSLLVPPAFLFLADAAGAGATLAAVEAAAALGAGTATGAVALAPAASLGAAVALAAGLALSSSDDDDDDELLSLSLLSLLSLDDAEAFTFLAEPGPGVLNASRFLPLSFPLGGLQWEDGRQDRTEDRSREGHHRNACAAVATAGHVPRPVTPSSLPLRLLVASWHQKPAEEGPIGSTGSGGLAGHALHGPQATLANEQAPKQRAIPRQHTTLVRRAHTATRRWRGGWGLPRQRVYLRRAIGVCQGAMQGNQLGVLLHTQHHHDATQQNTHT